MANTNLENQAAIHITEHFPRRSTIGGCRYPITCSCNTVEHPVRFENEYRWAMHLVHTLGDAANAARDKDARRIVP